MNWKKTFAHWAMPPGVQNLVRIALQRTNGEPGIDRLTRRLIERNRGLRNAHVGQRCFILATGPSIRELDLSPLQNECCIAVSEFYKHKQYRLISPAYYAFAPRHPPFTEEDRLRELEEMKKLTTREKFVFGLSDRRVVERSQLVPDTSRLHYIDFQQAEKQLDAIDLTAAFPIPCSAALIAVWIAIYMGVSQIYLVGCDHDALWKWDGLGPVDGRKDHTHFYEGDPTIGQSSGDVDSLLRHVILLRDTYRWTNAIARRQGATIYNANPQSRLDVVPRVPFSSLF